MRVVVAEERTLRCDVIALHDAAYAPQSTNAGVRHVQCAASQDTIEVALPVVAAEYLRFIIPCRHVTSGPSLLPPRQSVITAIISSV